jgi:hypothetical protein
MPTQERDDGRIAVGSRMSHPALVLAATTASFIAQLDVWITKAIQGGLVLTQTRRDRGQLWIALDGAHASLRTFSPEGGARGRA